MSVEAKLRLQISEFTRSYDAATAHAKKRNTEMAQAGGGVGASLAGGFRGIGGQIAGALSVGAVATGVKSLLSHADDVADLSVKLNESAEAIQRVDHAATLAGAGGVEQVGNAMLKLERNLGMVENAKAAGALERLGLSGKELMALPLDEKISALSGAFQSAREDGTGVADIMDLLGKGSADLIPLLGLAKDELDALFRDAPVLAEAQIVEMAKLNDQLDGIWAKMKGNWGSHIATMADNWQWFKDLVSTGSMETADIRMVDRNTDATKAQYARREAQKATAEGAEESRKAAEATALEDEKAKELKKDLEALAEIKEQLAEDAIDILPDDQKVDALKAKLAKMLEETAGLFSLNYETSTAGLEKIAQDREANKNLPGSGQNSAAEAYGWLEEARKLEAEIGKTEEKIAGEKKKAADEEAARQKELVDLRAAAEEGRVGLLSEEDRTKAMRDRLGESLGVKITGMADIESGLQRLRANADMAAINGDTEGEAAAQKELIEAQRQAAEFKQRIAGADSGPGKRGEFQTLVDEIFNRDPAAEQLRATEEALREQRESRGLLDSILKKMDEPVPRDSFSDFGT